MGLFLFYRYRSRSKPKDDENVNYHGQGKKKITEVTHVHAYVNGVVQGPAWEFLVGGGALYGDLSHGNDTFTTDNGAYIQQDLSSGIVGNVQKFIMINFVSHIDIDFRQILGWQDAVGSESQSYWTERTDGNASADLGRTVRTCHEACLP